VCAFLTSFISITQLPLNIEVLPFQPHFPAMLAFEKYRPTSHFIPPHSWSNDPCGAVYIPETKEYILCYQWNPGTTEGGNSAWGMAISKDLITWQDCVPALTKGADTNYDSCGVFSGSIASTLVDGRRVLYLFYTSISTVPYPHWSIPYIHGESQSVAVSTDFGRSWNRHQHNPLLVDAPLRSFTTGWRDPFISEWRTLSKLRGTNLNTKYMLLSSGDKRSGPQLFLYESQDLLAWKPLSALLEGQADRPIAPGSSLHYGRNFECGSFFTLGDKDYILAGVEQHPSQTRRHFHRYTLWLSGKVSINGEGKPRFAISNFGRLDQGILYAPHIFHGPNSELLQLGWADEDQNSMTRDQGWAGLITLPRELCHIRLPVPNSPVVDEHMWEIDVANNTMTTLGVRPARQMRELRQINKRYDLATIHTIQSQTFEINATFTHLCGIECLIFNVRQAPNDREVTRIIISLPTNTITVDRSATSLTNGNPEPDSGPFQLFRIKSLATGEPVFEDLHVTIFVDNSIIEVYANDRFALSSRIYPTLDTSLGVSYDFSDGTGFNSSLPHEKVSLECWEGLANAWPGRERSPRGRFVDAIDKNAIDEKSATKVQISEPHLQAMELHLHAIVA
jgi:beta-fructofuranosidase